ncbi:holin [Fibrobacter sp.]|uniref:holin n=1 Tax=Fibrobacter sp. TaxID=35828 RepID=UPI003869A4DC
MIISLYTSRVTLSVLGVDDFGLYQVVSGIIVVFSFLSTSLSSSTQRFLNYEMGLANNRGMQEIFSNSFILHIIIAFVVVLLGEVVGVWFLNTKLVIPETRVYAANLIFQFTIFSFALGVLSVPFHATIIAHEKMAAFAYISIMEALLKLVVVVLLSIVACDKLILYGALILIISMVIQFIYGYYCYKNFSECRFKMGFVNAAGLSKLASFSGWTLLGGLRSVGHTQGISILINMFFGVAVNAAQGITNQVTVTVNGVVNNFLVALNPQIVQLYASKKKKELHSLLLRGCRISIFLVALISVPLLLETNIVLKIWLKEIPEYTELFIRFSLLAVLVQPYATVLQTTKAATGNVKFYHIVLAVIGLSHLPLAYYVFHLGFPPYAAMIIYVILILLIQIARIFFACRAAEMKIFVLLKEIAKCYSLVLISALGAAFLRSNMQENILSAAIICLVNISTSLLLFLYLGFPRDERQKILQIIKTKICIFKTT